MPIFRSMAVSAEPTSTPAPTGLLPRLAGGAEDVLAVVDAHLQVDGRLDGADLDADAAGGALGACDALEQAAGGPGGAAAHVAPPDPPGRHARDLGDNPVLDGGHAAVAQKRTLLAPLLCLGHISLSSVAGSGDILDVSPNAGRATLRDCNPIGRSVYCLLPGLGKLPQRGQFLRITF